MAPTPRKAKVSTRLCTGRPATTAGTALPQNPPHRPSIPGADYMGTRFQATTTPTKSPLKAPPTRKVAARPISRPVRRGDARSGIHAYRGGGGQRHRGYLGRSRLLDAAAGDNTSAIGSSRFAQRRCAEGRSDGSAENARARGDVVGPGDTRDCLRRRSWRVRLPEDVAFDAIVSEILGRPRQRFSVRFPAEQHVLWRLDRAVAGFSARLDDAAEGLAALSDRLRPRRGILFEERAGGTLASADAACRLEGGSWRSAGEARRRCAALRSSCISRPGVACSPTWSCPPAPANFWRASCAIRVKSCAVVPLH